ncbi:hypothetical protein [Micromonospora sp. WMMD1274]
MTTEEQTGGGRHAIILEYMRTVPGVLAGLSGLLAAVTGFVVALAAR